MPTLWEELAAVAADRLDVGMIPAIYAAASVPTPEIRAELQSALPR